MIERGKELFFDVRTKESEVRDVEIETTHVTIVEPEPIDLDNLRRLIN